MHQEMLQILNSSNVNLGMKSNQINSGNTYAPINASLKNNALWHEMQCLFTE